MRLQEEQIRIRVRVPGERGTEPPPRSTEPCEGAG